MADMNIPSMFDTQYAMDRQRQDDAMKAGQLPLGGGMMYASSLSGDLRNQGLMGLAGLMGGTPDPMIAKQQALEEVFQQFGNPQTPEDAVAIADALSAKGLYNEAMKFMTFANEMKANMPKAKTYADIEGYKLAQQQGYPGTFYQYQIDLKNADKDNNVSFGSIPQDFIVTTDDNGAINMQVIPGSPTDLANKRAKEAKAEGQSLRVVQKTVVIEDIDRLKTKIKEAPWYNPVAGTILAKFMENPYIGAGKNRIDAESLATTIKSSIGFDRLQQMREESPTGGALGQVSELELITLQATLGSLDMDQSEPQLLENLDRLSKIYQEMLDKIARTGDGTFAEKMYGSGNTSAAGSGVTIDNDPWKIR